MRRRDASKRSLGCGVDPSGLPRFPGYMYNIVRSVTSTF